MNKKVEGKNEKSTDNRLKEEFYRIKERMIIFKSKENDLENYKINKSEILTKRELIEKLEKLFEIGEHFGIENDTLVDLITLIGVYEKILNEGDKLKINKVSCKVMPFIKKINELVFTENPEYKEEHQKNYRWGKRTISSRPFTEKGEHILIAQDDEYTHYYNSITGEKKKVRRNDIDNIKTLIEQYKKHHRK